MAFAGAVGVLATRELRSNFRDQVGRGADLMASDLHLAFNAHTGATMCTGVALQDFGRAEDAVVEVVLPRGRRLCGNLTHTNLGRPRDGAVEHNGYRIASRLVPVTGAGGADRGFALARYARPLSDVQVTISRVWLFLFAGVLGGAALALLAGLTIARRAMRPISTLSAAAREIERTRDPARRVAVPESRDEVAALARTLDDMLLALDGARTETESALTRQQRFVADASHELRTPLTSVLANLELLAADLEGEQREAAGAALRSTRRMRRLVGDLLLLARADAGQAAPRRLVDLSRVLADAAGELGPLAEHHDLMIDAEAAAPVLGDPDELHRLALNLLENALRHTPPGAHVRGSARQDGGDVVLVVEDDGPGVPDALAGHIFDRFVRAAGDAGGGGSGLGLSIVHAVAQSHGGSASLERPASGHGARFEVRIPAAGTPHDTGRGASPSRTV
jgi:two-component system, OmpR family, sensor kinase